MLNTGTGTYRLETAYQPEETDLKKRRGNASSAAGAIKLGCEMDWCFMDAILVKILSCVPYAQLVTTRPDAVKSNSIPT